MFAAVTCRPDILFTVIYLSQFSCHPSSLHYSTVKRVFQCLRCTINDGLHFWRLQPHPTLPFIPLPSLPKDNVDTILPSVDESLPCAYADADWASNPVTRRSVSRSCVFLSGAPIVFQCKFQHCIALSATESELHAANETGKQIRCACSIL